MEAGVGIEPTDKGFAGLCITTLLSGPICYHLNLTYAPRQSQNRELFSFFCLAPGGFEGDKQSSDLNF